MFLGILSRVIPRPHRIGARSRENGTVSIRRCIETERKGDRETGRERNHFGQAENFGRNIELSLEMKHFCPQTQAVLPPGQMRWCFLRCKN